MIALSSCRFPATSFRSCSVLRVVIRGGLRVSGRESVDPEGEGDGGSRGDGDLDLDSDEDEDVDDGASGWGLGTLDRAGVTRGAAPAIETGEASFGVVEFGVTVEPR